jgi:glycosyltransferase involved in cell wall biosynthesis
MTTATNRISIAPTDHGRLSNTIWVDLTTIMRWDRPVVGVVRVEEQLTRWILDEGSDSIRFCRYDRDLCAFLDVDKQEATARIRFFEQFEGRVATLPGTETQNAVKAEPRVVSPESGKLRKKPRTAWAKVRRKLKKRLRRIRKIFGWPTSQSERATQNQQQHPAPEMHRVEAAQTHRTAFSKGDVYVSVGSDWDDKDQRRLYEYKQEFRLKVIGICYDTIPIKYPHLTMPGIAKTFPRYIADLAWVADHVMCISMCTKRDFMEFADSVGAPLPLTSFVRLGNDLLKKREVVEGGVASKLASVRQASVVTEIARSRFILFVSTIERRKNHELLYKVWIRLIESGCNVPNLVFVGMHGWGVDDLLADLHRDPRVRGRIRILHGISDAELSFLYERCEYTVYPSLYEGWGLPVVESFAFGKFCLCSSAGSLTEAGESLAEYLDPWDVKGWTDRIRHFSEHPEEIEARNKRVAESFVPHTWQYTSSSILCMAEALRRSDLKSGAVYPAS